jgi:transketolase
MQLTGSTSDILNIDSSKIKSLFKTFNWKIITISFICNICPIQRTKKLKKIIQYFNILQRPLVIICKTKKGSGVKEMEDDSIGWHYKSLDHLDSVTIKI